MKPTPSRALLVAFTFCFGATSCGSSDQEASPSEDASFEGGFDLGDASVADVPSTDVATPPPAPACATAGAACSVGFACCSGTCTGGKCVGAAVATDAAPTSPVCLAPTQSCTSSPQCCSGRCEPVTGMAGVIQCRDACRGNGVKCSNAQDCCSLGCYGGVCTDKLCIEIGKACTVNSECCSDLCDPTDHKCVVDPANSKCRPTGESCGSGSASGCCGATKDNDLCVAGRCALPPGTCRGLTAACTTDADCCSGHCDPSTKKCATVCKPTAGACTTGADCCTVSCTDGKCDPPAPPPGADAGAPPACIPTGGSCTTSAACCSKLCLGGFCDTPLK